MLDVLRANRGKNFVARITNPGDWPVVQNPDGSYSSHRMSSAEGDGRGYAFPTLFYNKETNSLYKPENPMAEARKTGEFIEFPNPQAAERFAEGTRQKGTGLLPAIRSQPPFAAGRCAELAPCCPVLAKTLRQ
jgi:hypothetical protein